MLITIDPFYDVEFYNRCKSSLENNKCDYREFISTRPPYNWFLEIPDKPNLLDFTPADRNEKLHLVSVAKPIKTQDFWKYYRRGNDNRDNIERFIINDAFTEAMNSLYSAFIWIRSKEQALKLSASLTGIKFWYFGKFFDRYKVYMVNNEVITTVIPKEDILVSCKDKNLIKLEQELNFKKFKLRDFLVKNSETVYILNGRVHLPVYKSYMPKF